MKSILALMLAVIGLPALASHYVLIYEDAKNVEHECTSLDRQYVEWDGYGTALRSGCSVSGSYVHSYPQVSPLDLMRTEIDSAVFNCRFVAYADLGDQSTYLVIDCRTY